MGLTEEPNYIHRLAKVIDGVRDSKYKILLIDPRIRLKQAFCYRHLGVYCWNNQGIEFECRM